MASVFDVAEYILSRQGEMSGMKLQKLVYYSLAWHAAWEDGTLFDSEIQAWRDGPVCPRLYARHARTYPVKSVQGDASAIQGVEKESIDRVLAFYGDKSSQWLSNLTHMEDPWRDARSGVADGEPCQSVIPLDDMARYYAAL